MCCFGVGMFLCWKVFFMYWCSSFVGVNISQLLVCFKLLELFMCCMICCFVLFSMVVFSFWFKCWISVVVLLVFGGLRISSWLVSGNWKILFWNLFSMGWLCRFILVMMLCCWFLKMFFLVVFFVSSFVRRFLMGFVVGVRRFCSESMVQVLKFLFLNRLLCEFYLVFLIGCSNVCFCSLNILLLGFLKELLMDCDVKVFMGE